MKRLYLKTVRCGVVRVEHRSTKTEMAARSVAAVREHRVDLRATPGVEERVDVDD
jgi:hypothetical protein